MDFLGLVVVMEWRLQYRTNQDEDAIVHVAAAIVWRLGLSWRFISIEQQAR